MSFRYIETSALLSALLEQDASARRAVAGRGHRITSALTFTEATRGLLRARLAGRISAEQERAALRWLRSFRRSCDVMGVTDSVLVRAGRPYPSEPIRTLDAIHLATAGEIGEPPQLITVVTRDDRVRGNAQALCHPVE
ncbi:MAG: type II toxin-antitoxin system VapC family toxin [Steroidobacteraceae bacterium]